MRTLTFLIALTLLPLAAAQPPGPAPGYDSAIDYAADYAAGQASEATDDPARYVEDHASPQALQNETEHAAYMACWAADDQGVRTPLCDAYYTPPGHAPPQQPPEPSEPCPCNATAPDVEATANETVNATTAFAGDLHEAVNATLEDPGNATSHGLRIVALVVGFAKDLAGGILVAAETVVSGALGCLGLAGAAGDASLDALQGVGAGLVDGTSSASTASGAALADGLGLVGDGAASAAGAVADGARATVAGIADAARSLGHGVTALGDGTLAAAEGLVAAALAASTAATDAVGAGASQAGGAAAAVGDAVADAARAVGDAVRSLFGGSSDAVDGLDVDTGVDVGVDADGLLDPVTGLLS